MNQKSSQQKLSQSFRTLLIVISLVAEAILSVITFLLLALFLLIVFQAPGFWSLVFLCIFGAYALYCATDRLLKKNDKK